MRGRFFRISAVSVALTAAAACASSEDEATPAPPDAGETTLDGGASPSDAATDHAVGIDAGDGGPSGPMCSPAGWCVTELPDPNLYVMDIWPFEKHAFALSHSSARGPRVLEWNDDIAQSGGWSYIDDNTQQSVVGSLGNVWAPNENEVYYSISDWSAYFGQGSFGGYIYHATRPAAPETVWSWTRARFNCGQIDSPAVWGIGNDVYAMSCNTIYRLTGEFGADAGAGSDAGAPPGWTAEYVDDDPVSLNFRSGLGTADDIWFVGWRGDLSACTTVVRKTSAGYQRIVDGVASGYDCTEKPGVLKVNRLNDYYLSAPGEIVGIPLSGGVVKIAANGQGGQGGQGGYTVTSANPGPFNLAAAWSDSANEVWLVSDYRRILHGTSIWDANSSYQYSTIALNGTPNQNTLAKIRGVSKSNLWAVGLERALHKTTP